MVEYKRTAVRSFCKKTADPSGFSLIEVAFVMVVLSVLLLPMLHLYRMEIKNQNLKKNTVSIQTASAALSKYVLLHGFYPVPATPGDAQGSASFGHSATEPMSGWPDCHVGTTPANVVCETDHSSYLNRDILIGTLPFVELNVPYTSVLDAQRNVLTYAVTKNLTDVATYSESGGGIIVLDRDGNAVHSGTANRSHFVVLTHGLDSRGAFSQSGLLVATCGNNGNSNDFENCDRDGTFRSNLIPGTIDTMIFDAASNQHFDDYVDEKNSSASGIWSYVPDTSGTDLSIRDRMGGNVAAGDCDGHFPCIPVSRLDIYGRSGSTLTPAVRADSIKTDRICYRGNTSGDSANSGAWSCVDRIGGVYYANNASGTDQTACIGAACPTGAAWNLTNVPPQYFPQNVMLDPATINSGTTLPESGPYWMSASNHGTFHRGNGILCVGSRAMNGVFDYDEACNDTSYISATSISTLSSCTVSGEYARGIDASGKLFCQTPAANN